MIAPFLEIDRDSAPKKFPYGAEEAPSRCWNPDLHGHGLRSRLHSQGGISCHTRGRIEEHSDAAGPWHQVMQELHPLGGKLGEQHIEPREVAARPGEAGDKAQPDRVVGDDEDDGDRPGFGLGREHRIRFAVTASTATF